MTTTIVRDLAFTVDQAALKTAVSAVVKRVPSRPSIPMLGCVRLALTEDRLDLSGYDDEAAITASLAVDGQGCGTVLVSARLLGLVETLPAKPVEVALVGDRLTVKCGTVRLEFPTMPADDYPALPELPPRIGTVDGDTFARAVRRAAVATGPDASLVVLTAVWMRFGEAISLGATDRYRMALGESPWSRQSGAPDALVPAKLLAELAPMFADASEVGVHVDDNLFGLSSRHVTVVARQVANPVDAKSVDHPGERMARIFPEVGDGPVRLDAAELVANLVRAEKVHEERTPILLEFRDGEVAIGANAADTTAAAATMACEYDGKPIEVRVNPAYLISAVKACGSAEVVLAFPNGPKKPFLVLPDGGNPYRHLIMPIQPDRGES